VVNNEFKSEIYLTAARVVELEDKFIDRAFEMGGVQGITKEEVKQYIRAVCDYRMTQLGFKTQFDVENPFEWLDWLTSSNTIENFFETNTVGYSKNSMVGNYAEAY
jgi:ribonucleoside-diphosphate reductase beta chain